LNPEQTTTESHTTVLVEKIPEELRRRPQWVVWKLEKRVDKLTKVPYSPSSGDYARSNSSETWGTFTEAREAALAEDGAGIGFVFTAEDMFCGVDLDECLNPETGEVEPWALEIVEELGSYTEISPGGTGLHVIVRAELPEGRRRTDKAEMYDQGRFFTMTGRLLPGTPASIEERQEELERLHRRLFSEPNPHANGNRSNSHNAGGFTGDDREIVERASRAKNGEKFRRLWAGDRSGYASRSEADLALVSLLAFWTGGDEARMDTLFRASGLYREKWERADYRERTTRAALARGDFYSPKGSGRSNPPDGGKPLRDFNLTDLGNSERFVACYGRDVRYCFLWAKWLVWTGSRWERDDSGRVHRLAKETVRGIYDEAAAAEDESERKALAKHATASEAEGKIKAMLELAKSDVPVSPDDLDADPWLLNAPNGTVDLRTGEIQPHRREDLITKMSGGGYDKKAAAPVWEVFLERVLPSKELRAFVQRGAGYSAAGDTSEQCLFINHGAGANGKSTFQEALAEALGDYATRTPTETLLAKRAGGIPNDVARLKGARFVAASETEEGRRLAESLVKDLTGQDTISARFMRAEWFDFKPTHKLWLSTNHKPEIRGTDNAIWRRIRLIPWSVTIPPAERDHKLSEKLREELAGILAWAVHGCLEWRSNGLRAPDEVRRATSAYRAEMDILAAFLTEECTTGVAVNAAAGALYGQYKEWCAETGEKAESQRKFGERLKERGFERRRITSGLNKGKFEYLGVGLLEDGLKVTRGGEPLGEKTGGGEPLQSERFTEETPKDKGNPPNTHSSGEWSEPKNDINASKIESRGVMCKKGSLHSLHSPADPDEDKYGDDKGDDNCPGDDKGDDNFHASSPRDLSSPPSPGGLGARLRRIRDERKAEREADHE